LLALDSNDFVELFSWPRCGPPKVGSWSNESHFPLTKLIWNAHKLRPILDNQHILRRAYYTGRVLSDLIPGADLPLPVVLESERFPIRGEFEALMQVVEPAAELIVGALGPYAVEYRSIELLRVRSKGKQGKEDRTYVETLQKR
jgi:hypothetical protein